MSPKPKASLTPLAESGVLDAERVDRLRSLGVTTVEELLGAIEADPVAMGEFFAWPPLAIEELRQKSIAVVPTPIRSALSRPVTRRHPTGARMPPAPEENHG